jgi:dihydroflavonol-4-reductase
LVLSSIEIKDGRTNTKILITGATGFIGGTLAQRWATEGLQRAGDVEIRALVRNLQLCQAQRLAKLGIQLVPGDLTNPASFAAACHGVDVIVHAAADTRMEDWRQVWATGVEATRQLYVAAVAAGVGRFIFISSLLVYEGVDGEMNEELKPAPYGDLYADTKIAAEEALLQQAGQSGSQPELSILRFPPVYGPGSTHWTDAPLAKAQRNRLIIPGDGQMSFLYLYVVNMIDALTAAILSPHTGLYNIWDGSTTYSQFMQYYCDMVGVKPRFIPAAPLEMMALMGELYEKICGKNVPFSRRNLKRMLKAKVNHRGQPEKAKYELKWQPRFTLQDGMALIQQEYAANGKLAQ